MMASAQRNQPRNPPHATVFALCGATAAARGQQPAVVFADDATGERTELSYATFANWAAKTANLLTEELELQPGGHVRIVLGAHWTAMVWAVATWYAGGVLVAASDDDPAPSGGQAPAPAVRVVREDVLGGAPGDRAEVVVGTGFGGRVLGEAGAAVDYGVEVLAMPDDVLDPAAAPDAPALWDGGEVLTQAALLEAAAGVAAAVGGAPRVLAVADVTDRALLVGLLATVTAGGTLLLVSHADAGGLAAKAEVEGATHVLVAATATAELGLPALITGSAMG